MAAVLGAPVMRVLGPADDAIWPALARLQVDAYPVMKIDTADGLAAFTARLRTEFIEPGVQGVVAERAGALVGAMRLFDFTMNVRGRDAFTGGLGSVAVDLGHKRQGVGRALVGWYLDHYRERGASFAVLHPFRLDFYRKLGFGYGTPVQRYRFAPAALRTAGARGSARLLGPADRDALLACSERVRARSSGLIAKHAPPTARALDSVALRYVGVEQDGVLRAFAQTAAELAPDGITNRNDLVVRDLQAEDDTAFAALLAYFAAQREQFRAIVVESQDDALYLAADDPRDGSDAVLDRLAAHRVAETGLGVMYRVLDVERAVAYLPAADAPFVLRLEVADAFYPATHGGWTFRFGPHGAPLRDDGAAPDATLRLGIADVSSLVVGALDLPALVRHRLASLEPVAMLPRVARAFAAEQRPVCNTRF